MPKNKPNELVKYSGIAFKMMAVILIMVFVGKAADSYFNCKPICTISFSILSVFIALYSTIREFLYDSKK